MYYYLTKFYKVTFEVRLFPREWDHHEPSRGLVKFMPCVHAIDYMDWYGLVIAISKDVSVVPWIQEKSVT